MQKLMVCSVILYLTFVFANVGEVEGVLIWFIVVEVLLVVAMLCSSVLFFVAVKRARQS